MKNDIQELKQTLALAANNPESEEKLLQKANDKLARILQETSDNAANSKIAAIRAFIDTDEVQKRKVLTYCIDFVDPTVVATNSTQKLQICRHAFLKQDELYMLNQFVAQHSKDVPFGTLVHNIMNKHGMTAPQVYKNVLLRKQDFSRVTSPDNRKVTKRMAWQIIIGLHCSMKEAKELLFSAGYACSNSQLDLTMQFFIQHQNYDIEAIDAILSDLGLKTFTCE